MPRPQPTPALPSGGAAEVPAAPQPAKPRRLPLPVRVAWWLLRRPGWWLARRLWRHRDLHTPWWIAIGLYLAAVIAHAVDAAWWITLPITAAITAAATGTARYAAGAERFVQDLRDTVTGAATLAAIWTVAATLWGPATPPTAIAWAVLTAAVVVAWWRHPAARAWRTLRARVRTWTAALPAVLAQLAAAGVVVAARPTVHGNGRVEFPLRLPIGVTRADLEKLRTKIESGMHWPEGSIREIVQDPNHTASSRVVLIWHEGRIQARVVKFAPPKIPASIYELVWLGVDDDGRDVYVAVYMPGQGMSRGVYVGESGSAKSNLLRLLAWMLAHAGDVLLWVIDLKNDGLTYAPLLPRLDRPIATTWDAATRILEDAAAAVPLRGRLLRPEDNQLLPLGKTRPAILIIGDEIATLLGKKPSNAAPIAAAKEVGAKGRANGIGMEAASQYLSQTSMHPDLLPLFNRRVSGRTAAKADAQHVLKGWHRLDTTILPTGAFYTQQSGSDHTGLLFTPQVTDMMLAQAAADTAHLTPALEDSTADALPHYADRWADLPDHLLPYASPEQQEQVYAARARRKHADLKQAGTREKVAAAADRTRRLVVVESLDNDDALTVEDITDKPVRKVVEKLLSSPTCRTGDLVDASGRSRQWLHEHLSAWHAGGAVDKGAVKGEWKRRAGAGESDIVRAVLEAEEGLRARRRSAAQTGETQQTGDTHDLH